MSEGESYTTTMIRASKIKRRRNEVTVGLLYESMKRQLKLELLAGAKGMNRKIKKSSYSFICEKGYSPPLGGENSFLSTV